jgi:penicillin-binding protein 1A
LLYNRRAANNGRVIDPQYVGMMNQMMEETLLTGTARKAELPGWQAAGKTGTSQDWRDAWFVGYTSYLVAGVWLGNDDGSATKKVSGGNLPVEIWSRFMKAAHLGVPVVGLPLGDAGGSAPDPAPAAPPPAPVAQAVGPPLTINRGGEAATGARPPAASAVSRDLLPPASIPNAGAATAHPPPIGDKSLFDRLFGST